jgi:2-oxoisovalerate dehydrogenase E1 component beta subunit
MTNQTTNQTTHHDALQITYLEAIQQALAEELEADPRVFLMGEDIGVYGGAFKVTAGFLERFGADRVIDTPISEAGIVGAAVGAVLMGKRPVVEMQFMDFVSNAFNPIVNFAAKLHYRTGDAASIVIRGPSGGTLRAGPFHSQSVESYFLNVPGLKVVVPATVEDAKGLLKAAIRDPNPVLFLEQKALYRKLKAPAPGRDHVTPLGVARVMRAGADVSVISWGAMAHRCLEAAGEVAAEGVSAEVIDLRTLCPLDEETILRSVRKTSRALVVHEAPQTGGFGGEVVSRVVARAFEWLDAPPLRLGAADTPIPYAAALEDAVIPTPADIAGAIRRVAAY